MASEPFVVNIVTTRDREDRRARCREIVAERPWLRAEFVEAPVVPGPFKWASCTVAHQMIVYEAYRRGLPYVIVAEDDFEPTEHFTEGALVSTLHSGIVAAADAIYTGTVTAPQFEGPVFSFDTGLMPASGTMSTQFVFYFASYYQRVLSLPFGERIDSGLACSASKRMLTVPFLTTQRDGYSDLNGREMAFGDQWTRAERLWKERFYAVGCAAE